MFIKVILSLFFILFCDRVILAEKNNGLHEIHFVDDENRSYVLESSYGNNSVFIQLFNESLSDMKCHMTITSLNPKNISDNETKPYHFYGTYCSGRNATYARIGINLPEDQLNNFSLYLSNYTQNIECISNAMSAWLSDYIIYYLNHPYCTYISDGNGNDDGNDDDDDNNGYYYYYNGHSRNNNTINIGGIIAACGGSLAICGAV